MDSSSSVRTLEPSNIYLPKCWKKFLVRLSNNHDLAEKMVLFNQAKFHLEKEAARLAASQLEPFSMAMEIVTNAIISIDEEKKGVMQDMKRFQAPGTSEPSSGAALFDGEHHLTAEVTRNSRKRNREFEEPINKDRKCHGICMQLDQEGPRLFIAPFSEQQG